MIKDINQAQQLSEKYNIPVEDIILIALNCSGVVAKIKEKRIRFKLRLTGLSDVFYLGLCVNTTKSPFSIEGDCLFLGDQKIGDIIEKENDTCDSTYFRRNKTALTVNSNSRSRCRGCKFCGTYNQDSRDMNNLLTKQKLAVHLNNILVANNIKDLRNFLRVTICTGCFGEEKKALNHLLMVRSVLDQHFDFKGTLRYVGSEIVSEKSFDVLKEKASPFALSFTIEVFTKRKQFLNNIKSKITLEKAKKVLKYSNKNGFRTNFLYVLGMEPIETVVKNFRELAPLMTAFPIINLFQVYLPGQENLLTPEARNIEYYLRVRKELEKIFESTKLRPESWENYRPLWYSTFKNEQLNGIRI